MVSFIFCRYSVFKEQTSGREPIARSLCRLRRQQLSPAPTSCQQTHYEISDRRRALLQRRLYQARNRTSFTPGANRRQGSVSASMRNCRQISGRPSLHLVTFQARRLQRRRRPPRAAASGSRQMDKRRRVCGPVIRSRRPAIFSKQLNIERLLGKIASTDAPHTCATYTASMRATFIERRRQDLPSRSGAQFLGKAP